MIYAPAPDSIVGGFHVAKAVVHDVRKVWQWTDSNNAADKTGNDFGDLDFEPIP